MMGWFGKHEDISEVHGAVTSIWGPQSANKSYVQSHMYTIHSRTISYGTVMFLLRVKSQAVLPSSDYICSRPNRLPRTSCQCSFI